MYIYIYCFKYIMYQHPYKRGVVIIIKDSVYVHSRYYHSRSEWTKY